MTTPDIAALERRVAALEQRPSLRWHGVFVAGECYPECALTTHRGSLWVATQVTRATPGTPESGWRLCVKQGHVS